MTDQTPEPLSETRRATLVENLRGCELPTADAAADEIEALARELQQRRAAQGEPQALRDIHKIARRVQNGGGPDDPWAHVLRLCEAAGVSSDSGVMREEPQGQAADDDIQVGACQVCGTASCAGDCRELAQGQAALVREKLETIEATLTMHATNHALRDGTAPPRTKAWNGAFVERRLAEALPLIREVLAGFDALPAPPEPQGWQPKTCATCQKWRPCPNVSMFGDCLSVGLKDMLPPPADDYDEWLRTPGDFGCTLHEAKP